MNPKLLRTVLLALAIGFFTMWVLEFRRAGMFESYWLLLLSIVCLLTFQFRRLKASLELKKEEEIRQQKKEKPAKLVKK